MSLLVSIRCLTTIIVGLLCTFPNAIQSYKVGIFVLSLSGSQIIYNIRVAELLADAGHNVTLIRIELDPKASKIKSKNDNIGEIRINGLKNASQWQEVKDLQANFAFRERSMLSAETRKIFSIISQSILDSCEAQITNSEYINQLKSEQFDVAISHMYDFCAIGIIHHLNIKGWIWLSSGALMDIMPIIAGAPSPPSYVPGMMTDMTDRMNFWQRTKNFIGKILMMIMAPKMMINPETELFRQHIDKDFPNLASIAANCSLIMANTDELYDFPRPILHKIIYVGGIGMTSGKPLEGEYKTIVDNHNQIVVMSFGSVANETTMPIEWKQAIIGAFKHFPDVYFIWKYEIDDIKHQMPDNVLLTPWLPQKDLLYHKNVKVFVTHGGYNSLQEAINSATPIITIPLFGDQYRNGRLAEKHGFGIDLLKSEFSQQTLIDAISRLLNDQSYTLSVERLSEMVRKKPVKAEHLMIKWVEFIAEFKELPNLRVASIDLNIIEYFCIDVMFVLFAIVSTAIYIIYRLFRVICSKVLHKVWRSGKKQKLS